MTRRRALNRTVGEARLFFRGGNHGVTCVFLKLLILTTLVFKCHTLVMTPHTAGTTRQVTRTRCHFRRRGPSCRLTLRNSTGNTNFLSIVRRCNSAPSNGLTGRCTNVYCLGANSLRGTTGCLTGCSPIGNVPKTLVGTRGLNLRNSVTIRRRGCTGTIGFCRRTIGTTSGGLATPVCLHGTNLTRRTRNGGRGTTTFCRRVLASCPTSASTHRTRGLLNDIGWPKL